MSKSVARLYKYIRPIQYDLALDIDDQKLTFHSKEEIIFNKTKNPTKRLTFHQKGLKITKVNVYKFDSNGNLEELKIKRVNKQDKSNELRIHFGFLIFPGKYLLKIEYSGIITEEMNGIYPSSYNFKGKKERIISTQFESHHAREAFVCIDEPEAKATFILSLITSEFNTILSNSPVLSSSKKKDKVLTKFKSSPIMSSYLVAFVIGNFDRISSESNNGIKLSVFGPMGKADQLKFGLSIFKKCLDFYQEYFNINYPLEKCDLVAIPDFASGAMENWGLITFREHALLYNPKISSIQSKEYVANVIAHELTHQWFGNLVTMEWWSDLWLNESFASWMSYLAIDHLYPEWKVWDKFIVDEQNIALKEDSLKSTHPILVKIHHPDEIRSIFDVISYEKGASVIAMLEAFMGAENFRKGISYYLKKHQYNNARTDDLWEALEANSDLPIKNFMYYWINYAGFPKLSVKYRNGILSFSQKRFFVDKDNKEDNHPWPIPIITNIANFKMKVFNKFNQELSFNLKQDLFIANKLRKGFYRTSYDSKLLSRIIDNIKSISLIDRFSILNDMFELSKAREFKTVDLLRNLDQFIYDRELIIWEEFGSILRSIRLIMSDQKLNENINRYILAKTKDILEYYGFSEKKTDSYFDKQLRPLILALNDLAKNPDIKKWTLTEYSKDSLLSDVSPDIRPVIYLSIARNNLRKDYLTLLKIHNHSSDPEQRLILANALCMFKAPDLIKSNLDLLKSDAIRIQDLMFWINSLLANKSSRKLIWNWIKENWKYLNLKIGNDLGFSRLPVYVARVNSSEQFLNEYKDFFESNSTPALRRSIDQGIEIITWHYKWVKEDYKDISNFFKKDNL